jgi:hypothetical protein
MLCFYFFPHRHISFVFCQREKTGEHINVVSQSLLNGKAAFKENSSTFVFLNLKGSLE